MTTTEITRIKQVDGSTRVVYAQDEEHAARARAILHSDPAMVDRLDGVDGIRTRVVDEARRAEKLKITLSERRPITLVKADWPLIARADRHDGAVECQANHEWAIRVREHADGRRVVYGWLTSGNGGVPLGWRGAEGGFLVPDGDEDETVRAIRRVGGIIDDDALADECIADLPAEDIGEDAAASESPQRHVAKLIVLLDRAMPYVPASLADEIRATMVEASA